MKSHLLFFILVCLLCSCDNERLTATLVSPASDTLDVSFGDHIDLCYQFNKLYITDNRCQVYILDENTGALVVTGGFALPEDDVPAANRCWKIYIDQHFTNVEKIRARLQIAYGNDTANIDKVYWLQ